MAAATADIQACIDACNSCIGAANRLLARHIGERAMERCLKLSLDCVDLCAACVPMLQRGSEHAARVCGLLDDLCTTCADECDRFDSEECRRCARACRECADACRAVAAA